MRVCSPCLFKKCTIKAKARTLKHNLADILANIPECGVAETIRAKMVRASPRLLTFLNYPGEVEVTKNNCERTLWPAVIQRKVTNGFPSMWAAEGDCAVRTCRRYHKNIRTKTFRDNHQNTGVKSVCGLGVNNLGAC